MYNVYSFYANYKFHNVQKLNIQTHLINETVFFTNNNYILNVITKTMYIYMKKK